ncbi:Membrane-fusion protein [Legionella wadsworthii]|uniref:Membrane-fusion protein n=1 Tax=Legionella wadsworthii TaxID=28088 RepID=A0A378LUY4_9GAMM|nr:efflux RND transporter periplasmic adaptor subunit [Legionella wadsworthii]STY27911.1 Membrane-fusion protein [Legionella wadsworthii]
MNRYYKISKIIILLFTCTFLFSCGNQEKQKTVALNEYKVEEQALQKTLHFTGTVQPLHENTLASPMEAVVETMNFHYGQRIKKDEVILTLNSTDLQKQFNDALTEYLKAKDSYSIAKAKFVGTQDLWDSGLLSKNNYMSERSNVDTSRITLMQSTHKLTEMLEKLDGSSPKNLSALSLGDFEKIKKILASQHNTIHLKASRDGVLLYPPKAGEDKSVRVTVGSTVKPGQVIGLIGDLSGIRIEIDVPEIDITQIKAGMEAIVTGVAFGKYQLKGELVSVNAQATNNNGLPFFTAVVEVKELTPEQQQWIKVGMSSSIELKVDSGKQLIIPINAIKREKGQSLVRLKTKSGSIEKRVITTGAAQADSVVVETGLKAGDVVVYG